MGNSASSGNILGYASGTQPGLVSTVAQTFAGDKTLSGLITASGGIINTGLTGTNATTSFTAGSGKVGEVVTSGAVIGNFTTGAVSAGGSITIGAGIWSISALVTVSGSGTSSSMDIAINTANNTFTGTTNGVDRIRFITSGGYGAGTIANKLVKTTASSTTYYIIGQSVGTNANCDTSITAARIA